MRYTGRQLEQISFPLGGIGTGCVGLAGNGRLIDWEIFGHPDKGRENGFSHFAVKAEQHGEVRDVRILQGPFLGSYQGQAGNGQLHSGFGFGPNQFTMAGFPHFESVTFDGDFPVAGLQFADHRFPGQVRLTAFNPFLPMNDRDSSIPAAFFEIQLTNDTTEAIDYTVAFAVQNPVGTSAVHNRFATAGATSLLTLSSDQYPADDRRFGGLAAATDATLTSHQEYWYRGGWSDPVETYWRELCQPGGFRNRRYDQDFRIGQQQVFDTGVLAAHQRVAAGSVARIRFVLAWHFPNAAKTWDVAYGRVSDPDQVAGWRHHYATVWPDAAAVALEGVARFSELHRDTQAFRNALHTSSLPPAALDAVSANLAVLKSPTTLRLTGGELYAFEGCGADFGSCEGSCQHVWNYGYAVPFLFPALERSMRELELTHSMRSDGRLSFRLQLPLGSPPDDFRAAADGQFGTVIKCYREWRISGDHEWLARVWPATRKALAYAWAETNEDRWDPQRTGVLAGRQHHTLDMELFGPNSWLQSMYLCALQAGAAMAEAMGEADFAAECRELFERGRRWADRELFNGSYYGQRIELSDRSLLAPFAADTGLFGDLTEESYWNTEAGELKYQIGDGCGIDQVLGQWHANLCGLGEILDPEQTRTALRSLFTHNYRPRVGDQANPWRLYSLDDEGGLIMCSWPEGVRKPAIPLTYNSETMTGFEYQAACHMLQTGLREPAETVVASIRARYDGVRRNPFSELECGSNYARSLASYSLLLAYSGFSYDTSAGLLGFAPLDGVGSFLWSVGTGWGTVDVREDGLQLVVEGGQLTLTTLECPVFARLDSPTCRTGADDRIPVGRVPGRADRLSLPATTLGPGEQLVIAS
ncbi:MAG: GH116 family glycosyl-hydrolase [Propionicimonas sp.]